MAKVTFFFVENEEDNTVGIEVEMEFIPRVGETVQGFFSAGRNGTWIVRTVNYQLYEQEDSMSVYYAVSLRRYEPVNEVKELIGETFNKSGKHSFSEEELKAKEFSMFEVMKEVFMDDDYENVKYYQQKIESLEVTEKEIQHLAENKKPLLASLDHRIHLYENRGESSGTFGRSRVKIIKKFAEFIDVPDAEIVNELMKNKHLYQNILINTKALEYTKNVLRSHVKDFTDSRRYLSTKSLFEKINSEKERWREYLDNILEERSKKMARIEYLQNQPVDKLSFFELEKGKRINPLLETGEWCIKDDLKVAHADFNVFEVKQKNEFYVEIDVPSDIKGLLPIKGWLPKEYYKLQYERLSLLEQCKNR